LFLTCARPHDGIIPIFPATDIPSHEAANACIRRPDAPALDEDERTTVTQRLDNLMADPARQDFGEPDVVAYIDRQRDRLTDDNGVPIRSDFEPFRPAVKRSDAWLESPVGEGQTNHPLAVFNTKKLLGKAGFHSFKPGIEP
jgi:hypothetical protein